MELNWENAKAWEEKANEKKEIYDEPKWSWDCVILEKSTVIKSKPFPIIHNDWIIHKVPFL
jgi:hypothetical protein